MPTDTRTDPALLARLRMAASVKMTPEERRQQRISFIHGGLSHDSTLSHADIARMLDKHEGTREFA